MKKRMAAASLAMIPMLTMNVNAENIKTGIVSSAYLNVRYSPSASAKLQLVLKKGNKVTVIGEKNGWYKIKTASGKTGWVVSKYISLKADAIRKDARGIKKIVTATTLNVRSGPDTSYTSIGKLYKNNEVDVISESNGWSKIQFGSKIGYVSSEYLKSVSTGNNNSGNTGSSQGAKKTIQEVTSSLLHVRNGAGGQYTKIDTLHKGDKVVVSSIENNWAKVEYDGKNGYVSSIYLKYVSDKIDDDSTDINGTASDIIQGAYTQRSQKDYSLEDMVEAQYIKGQSGGNLISRQTNRLSDILNSQESSFTTYLMRKDTRAYGAPTKEELEYYLDPSNFTSYKDGIMQFVRLDRYTDSITAKSLNNYFESRGSECIFNGKGQAFIDAAKKYNIDVLYFVSHAMWETGNGKSKLAQGQLVTSVDGVPLETPVTVYNFFGIGATDGNALEGGKMTAYKNGWTTVEKGIDGAAKWISDGYIHNSKYKQNTVYSMRWCYEYTWHQYATDVNWANGISKMMSSLMTRYGNGKNLLIDIPEYKY